MHILSKTAIICPLAAILVACGGDKSQTSTQAPTDKALTVVTPWEITNADPSTSGFVYQRLGIGETLTDVDDKGAIIPALAETWETPDNGKTWTFTLRGDVKFHDGTPMTAKEVANSLNIALKKPTALENAKISTIEATDDKTLTFTLSEPVTTLPAFLAHATAIILAPASFDDKGQATTIIGTGAYKADNIEPPQKLEQSAYGDYWGQKASINRITYLANSRSETRTLLAEGNDDHLVYTLDSASLKRLQANPDLQVATATLARTIALKMNIADPRFADKVVRQALSDAIDRDAIAQSVLRIGDAGAYELLPPMFGGWQVGNHKKGTPDYTAIKATLLANGFTEQGDLLHKDGKPFTISLITFSDRPELPLIATALQDQWRKIGVDLQVNVTNASEIPKAHQDGSLQMALYARNYGMSPDPLLALSEDLNPKGSDWGVMNYKNDELTQALHDIASTTDDAKKAELKQKIAKILVDERPLIPVVYYQQSASAHKSLQGLTLDPFERKYNLNLLKW
ncbi:MAG: ABC transporter substrate-binding protein [Moraxella sp.]|uniref:ABC transporter substrate-binding protein n=1 Tax=Moraxella sp. TaxID=479 RepID=UPI0026DB6A69|nr:ABC transporter substrate-binding protein [Moraxella sp.]MDO4451048.1 ABC transporter substrate-binding protein [Moraxella sp.]